MSNTIEEKPMTEPKWSTTPPEDENPPREECKDDARNARLLTCPWCGYEDRDSWERGDSDDRAECGRCTRLFAYDSEAVRYFTAVRIEEPPR